MVMLDWNNGWMGQTTQPFMNFQRQQLPHYDVIKVNGEAGARSFQMAPNSSIFLADSTNPNLIWLVQTDGAGYLTPTPLDVSIHQDQPQPNFSNLEERIKHLEDMYEQLNSGFNKQSKRQPTSTAGSKQFTDTAN